ncbi:unnamed protein product [Closterium sp. NIES-53]
MVVVLHCEHWDRCLRPPRGVQVHFSDVTSETASFFPLRSKGDVTEVLIDWIRAARLQLRESFGSDFPVLRLHSDRGREFSSARLGAFCRARGIRQTFTLPASPQKNGIAERRIGMVMDVARTSMIHAAAPHFLWPFALQYALRVPLPSPPESSLPVLADPASDALRAASPTVARLLSTVGTGASFESAAASALVAELFDFAARFCLDYAAGLVAESASVCPPSVGGECALSTDVLEDRQEEFQCFGAALPHLVSMLIAPEGDPDAPDIQTPRSYAEAIEGTYVDEVPPPGANIVSGMWIFRVKRPPGSPPVFKARYVVRGSSQQQGVDYFQTFSPTPKMTTLRVLLHVAAQRDYELHSLHFSTTFLQGILHEEIWLRCPPGFTGSFPPGTHWSLRRPVYGLRQAPREWHDTLRTTLAALGFAPSTADPSLFLRTDTFAAAILHPCITLDRARRTITLTQSHMVQQVLQRFDFTYSSPQATPLSTRHSLSALPSDESVEPSGPILARYVAPGRHRPEHMAAAKRVLRYLCSTSSMGLVLGGRSPVVLTGHADASWVDDLATQRSSQGYTFSLGSGSVSWRSTRSSSVLSSHCEAEIYAGAMAAQELRWLTYLLTDLGEQPRSPPVLPTLLISSPRHFSLVIISVSGGAAGAGGAGGATGSAGGAGGAGGAGPTTDHHCLSWPLLRQSQRLGVHISGHCLSRTTPPFSSFETFSPQLLSELVSLRCVTGSVEAAALGASESAAAPGASESAAAPGASDSAGALSASESAASLGASEFAAALGASASTTIVVARVSTVLLCLAVPSGSLSGLHLPAFLTNLLSNAVLQDEWVGTFIPGGQHVAIRKCSRTGRNLATFTCQPWSDLYTLTTASAQVAESGQVAVSNWVSASGQLATSCSCLVQSHQTLLWHHRLGHPSLPRLRSMHSRLLVSGLPRSLPSLLCSLALPCLTCVEGRQPLVGGTDQECYFLLVVDDYTRYTTVFPLRHKADFSGVFIPWIRTTRRQLHERFSRDFPVLRLHSDRGGEFSSDLLAEFC